MMIHGLNFKFTKWGGKMKKSFYLKFIFISLFFLFIAIVLTSCSNDKYDPFNFDDTITVDYYTDETDTFRYVKEKRFDYEKSEYYDVVRLFGLTNKGSKLEYLYFPNQVDGMDVVGFGCNTSYVYGSYKKTYVSQFRSTNLKRLFFDKDFKCESDFFKDSYNLVSLPNCYVVWISVDGPTGNFLNTMGNIITWDMYINNAYSDDLKDNKLLIGNITYQYNYEDAPNNNIYFIDSYDDTGTGHRVEGLADREGYLSKGWYYKENDFEKRFLYNEVKLPKEINVNRKKYNTYNGLIVYASWSKVTS